MSIATSGVITTTGDALSVVASGATTSTGVARITTAALTTGTALAITANALTTGTGITVSSSSTDTGAHALVQLTNTGAGSTGCIPVSVNQVVQSTHFRLILKESNTGIKIWISDGTTGQGNLSGTAGDLLLNGGSGKPEYCTGTTNWTALV